MNPPELKRYKTMPVWDASTLPKGFQSRHNTKPGAWAGIEILSGKLRYEAMDAQGQVLDSITFDRDSPPPMIEPQAYHRVQPESDDLKMQLSFYCQPPDYYRLKYGLTAPHSEVLRVLEDLKDLKGGRILDLGSGRGRNALCLRDAGFVVDAIDHNPKAIQTLEDIIAQEALTNISARVGRAQEIDDAEIYDLVICTVVLMFLPKDAVPKAIAAMQKATAPGGLNLVVSAIDCPEYPFSAYQLPFDFGFAQGELASYYERWSLVRYNEELGHLHRLDEHGHPIGLRFATLLARKPLNSDPR